MAKKIEIIIESGTRSARSALVRSSTSNLFGAEIGGELQPHSQPVCHTHWNARRVTFTRVILFAINHYHYFPSFTIKNGEKKNMQRIEMSRKNVHTICRHEMTCKSLNRATFVPTRSYRIPQTYIRHYLMKIVTADDHTR